MSGDVTKRLDDRTGHSQRGRTYWCDNCEVPLLQAVCEACGGAGRILGPDAVRPVFKEEMELLAEVFGMEFPLTNRDLALWCIGRVYYYGGQAVARLRGTTDFEVEILSTPIMKRARARRSDHTIARLLRANRSVLRSLEYEAVNFIRHAVRVHQSRLPLVSYSGGKDSAVVSHLVRMALGRADIIHVFGDTTIELPETYAAVEEFASAFPATPTITARPRVDFFEMAEIIGPPSRIQRWCCTTHKTAPIAEVVRSVNGHSGVLTFCGLRQRESFARVALQRFSPETKIPSQIIANPILHWSVAAVWLYVLTRGLPINGAYRLGFTRVGCYLCPMNSEWSEFLVRLRYPSLHAKWRAILLRYATECRLHDPLAYVESGGWKGRVGGRKASPAAAKQIDRRPCLDTTLSCGYVLLGGWTERFFELLKPLGVLEIVRDDGITANLILSDPTTGAATAILRISRARGHVGIEYLSPRAQRHLSALLESQIRKLQNCVSCGGCASLCPQAAIVVEQGSHRIDEELCTHCLACIRRLRYGCLAADSLHV